MTLLTHVLAENLFPQEITMHGPCQNAEFSNIKGLVFCDYGYPQGV
jgi:hypothetical protein